MIIKRFVRWAVSDSHGRVVLGQPPNLPIMSGTLLAILAVLTPGYVRLTFALAAFGALFTWAWLEIFSGTTPLRRFIGLLFIVTLLALSVILIGALD